jgi:glycosyltransferase involved in cell wall biosynthesis
LNEEINKLGIQDHIEFLGYLSQDELLKRFIASDYFVLPSLEEGNPIVMFEALGFGLPFIGTDVGGIPEIIDEERYGLLVQMADPEALAGAISRGLKKKWNRKEIIEYSDEFTWEAIARKTVDLYGSVLK